MFGFPAQRHLLKVHPFVVRLDAARKGLQTALQRGDPLEIIRGVDDTSFWVGRSVAEMISASEAGEGNIPLFKRGLISLLKSQITIGKAKQWLKMAGAEEKVDTRNPISFLSPDGGIASPLDVQKSKIRNAGNGLHTRTSLPKGTVISPCRVKVKNTGNFFEDWRSFPAPMMVNHSPLPNLDFIGVPETSYLVTNRDISPDEELLANYAQQCPGYFLRNMDLPLEEWDRNVYHSLGIK
jgi:hypothetical protein